MSRPSGIRPAFAALVLLSCGCAYFSRTPDTPARHVQVQDLNQPESPGERYYLLVFGSQTTPKLPRYTHTWVTVVRAAPGGAVEHHSISWMPATLDIQPWRFEVEPGVNLDLDGSVRMALDKGERVSLWGP